MSDTSVDTPGSYCWLNIHESYRGEGFKVHETKGKDVILNRLPAILDYGILCKMWNLCD